MAHNYPKWPKNDARIYALFLQFFFTEKAVPQTSSLLECMVLILAMVQSQALVASKHHLIETEVKTLSPNKLASSDYQQQFQVARKDLYLNYAARDQLLDQLIETDYVSSFTIGDLSKKKCQFFQDCRYSQSKRDCYCCGAFFHYTEQVCHAKPIQTLLSRDETLL